MKTVFIALICLPLSLSIFASDIDRPKLVLQLTVDQLRPDLIERYKDRFVDNGFNYLLNNGVSFSNAQHPHAVTETIVGHTSLATGATPSIHGMISNRWYDQENEQMVYSCSDPTVKLIGATGEGQSPANIRVDSFSDHLIQSLPGARAFAVSVKDRGAIPLAGKKGKAWWYSKSNGRFISSSYYYQNTPKWVKAWNKSNPTKAYDQRYWKLLNDKKSYVNAKHDDRHWENNPYALGRTFPHYYGKQSALGFYPRLSYSPAGDELTSKFSQALIDNEQLGQQKQTDYLAISFSSADYIGHQFGPNSLEAEDNILRLDRVLAELLNHIDKSIGLENTLIVLSSDHGVADNPNDPEAKKKQARFLNIDQKTLEAHLNPIKQQHKISGPLIKIFNSSQVYLRPDIYQSNIYKRLAFEKELALSLAEIDGIDSAYSYKAINMKQATGIERAIGLNDASGRSGDIHLVFEKHAFNQSPGYVVSANHGSVWDYDTHIPLIFVSPLLKPKTNTTRVESIDVAPTLAKLLKLPKLNKASGQALFELSH
ncbi:alkaline phosphatase family protein [Agaribacterium sp. ZY112]|uniref:alkaline phosphatase family protein n=1 Tax=Agaribacterium sp. ZY112 TaxID=3233574 RepID=UPI003526192B